MPDETINGIGIGYKLTLIHINGTTVRNFTINASALMIDIAGLEIWTNYTIKMKAFTVMGDGPWSDFIKEHTDEEGKPREGSSLVKSGQTISP